VILSDIKPRCRSQGWEERACQTFSVLSLLQQCHPSHFQPSATASLQLQRHCSATPAKQMTVLLEQTGDGTKRALKPCVFWWARHSAETIMPRPEDMCHATRSLVSHSWEQPLFSPSARYCCPKRLWLPSSKLHPHSTTQGPAEPSTPTSTSRLCQLFWQVNESSYGRELCVRQTSSGHGARLVTSPISASVSPSAN